MISPTTAPHYTWADVCDGWKLVDTPGLNVIQERMPTGTQEVRYQHSRVAEGRLIQWPPERQEYR